MTEFPMDEPFRLTCAGASDKQALKAADEIEAAIGEIANGRRKPAKIPIQPIACLVQFARERAWPEDAA